MSVGVMGIKLHKMLAKVINTDVVIDNGKLIKER